MSIYPRIIELGEYINIHFNLKINSKYDVKGEIIIEIISKRTKTIFKKKVVGKKYYFNHYFRYLPYDCGLHKVTAYFKFKGKRYYSKTIDTDIFLVKKADARFMDLFSYLSYLFPKENKKLLLEDVKKIFSNKKNLRTKAAKEFVCKLSKKSFEKYLKSCDYKRIMEGD